MVAGALSFLGTGFYSYSRGIFLPSLAQNLDNGERFYISMGFSLTAVTTALVAPYIGRYLDRGSPRKVMLVGILIMSCAYWSMAHVTNLVQYFFVVALGMGLGIACMGGLSWHRSVINWFDHWRGRAIALSVLGASLAGIVMPPLVAGLVDNYGLNATYTLFGTITALALFPIVFLFMKDKPSDVGEIRDGRQYVNANPQEMVQIMEDSKEWTIAQMYRSRAFWSIGIMFGAMTCVFSAVMLHLYSHFTDIGLEKATAAYILSFVGLFAAIGKPIVGWLSDYLGARISIWIALLSQGVALLIFSVATEATLSFIAACLYGFGLSGMSPLRTFSISTALGSKSFGTATGAIKFIELPFILSASPIAGLIYDTTGSYQIAFFILAGLMLAACIGPFFITDGGKRGRDRRRLEF
jgi:MFS family permease